MKNVSPLPPSNVHLVVAHFPPFPLSTFNLDKPNLDNGSGDLHIAPEKN
jgi:hypothetical protein